MFLKVDAKQGVERSSYPRGFFIVYPLQMTSVLCYFSPGHASFIEQLAEKICFAELLETMNCINSIFR